MMGNPAELQAQWEALQEARASGARRIVTQTGGVRKEIEYKTDAEMAAALAALERQMAAFSARPFHTVRIAASKGFSS